jgi:phenylacetate-coenzyme A ligase PaaK-like adenylate-forming protein
MNLTIVLELMHQLEQMRKHEGWTRAQLDAHQSTSLQGLREHAYAHSPFYQRFHKGLMNRSLQELPVLTKAELMENFADVATDRAIRLDCIRKYLADYSDEQRYLGRYWISATSGSTGTPGLFVFDRSAWISVLASFARAHEWGGQRVNLAHRMKMASVASTTPWHMSAQVGASLRSWWMPVLRLAATEPLAEIVHKLNEFNPDMLVAYASMARILAEEQLGGRLHIQPHLVFISSEVLTSETRRLVGQAWGHPPLNQYAATEMGGMAAETVEHRGPVLFEDQAIFEVVDEKNQPVPAGESGAKFLITVLFNHTQPLIRYVLSDSVRLSTESALEGWPFAVIDSVQGRSEDVLHLPAVNGGELPVQPLTFHRVLDSLSVSGWQIVQDADRLCVLIGTSSNSRVNNVSDEVLISALAEALAAQGVKVPPILVQHVNVVPKNASGKAPLIKVNRPEHRDR